ncbi:tRNA (adenosine(37)-N6)-dimethylallyltransferase MiaA [Parapedobacter lycopersici]|uniref:tRNA (adenosine(37)-N6)-dimethylallyltransferase MiaA n=1 Tax=Parapedobacter lycopersici TaxID=1864939 RepID=UPI00214DB1E7
MKNTPPLLVIFGPTASGKTSLAIAVAKQVNGEIISADSRQVYRGMDIGTGKDLELYQDIPYHLIDIRDAGDTYHVAQYQQDFRKAMNTVIRRGKQPILCGGTGLYLQAAISGFAYSGVPVVANRREVLEKLDRETLLRQLQELPVPPGFTADTSTKKRIIRAIEIAEWHQEHPVPRPVQPTIRVQVFGINPPVEVRRQRITDRLVERLDTGLVEEVRRLLDQGIPPQQLIRYGLEYKYTTQYLLGELDYDTFFARLNTEIHRYAKRQMTYFRKMEKDGLAIHWLPQQPIAEMAAEILTHSGC